MRRTTLLANNPDMSSSLIRYVKFLGTSLVGTIVDTLVLWILSDHIFSDGYWKEYVFSPILSFQAAVLVNYIISYSYVWKDRILNTSGRKTFLKLYLAYNASCSTVFLFRLGAINLIGRFTGWDVVLCNILAMCVSGIINFLITNNVIFRKRKR